MKPARLPFVGIAAWTVLAACWSVGWSQVVQPFPRQPLPTQKACAWTFAADAEGWVAQHDCKLVAGSGTLHVHSVGRDPYLISPPLPVKLEGPVIVRMRMKSASEGPGQFYWTTHESPGWSERQSARFRLVHDGTWHEYEVQLSAAGTLRRVRLDPGAAAGAAEVDWIQLYPLRLHPLDIESVETTCDEIRLRLRNHAPQDLAASVAGRPVRLAGRSVQDVTIAAAGDEPFQYYRIEVLAEGLPALRRCALVCRPDVPVLWVKRTAQHVTLLVAPDGSGAKLLWDGRLAAVLAPLASWDGVVPKLRLQERGQTVRLEGEDTVVTLRLEGSKLHVATHAAAQCEGPVVRALGSLEQGLFAGLEYLGKGEHSSSTLDIETPDHLRFAPDPLKVTMPLMAFRTDRCTVAMTWRDMHLQPIYATPNFLDGAPGHRMALRGTTVEATIRLGSEPLEAMILWAAGQSGLPPLPPSRSRQEQWQLCLAALNGPLKNEQGWGHCAEPRWRRQPYADMASTIFRMTGRVPDLPRLAYGGSHWANEAAYLLTGRARQWLALRRARVRMLLASQQPDGSFRYRGKYQRGHFEDTASGWCAPRAVQLLEQAQLTGDPAAQKAGLRALEFMKRFRTPRGAQTWELSLHTPDILAAAHLVRAYVRGYQLTGRREYLELARKWALAGVPFVYLWGKYPIMTYATVPVYGATNWRAPNWIGRPVQWCGLVYAYALTLLAPYDNTLDWKHLARGILYAGQQMQYPDGDLAGCLADSFDLPTQQRAGPAINPCALVNLRLALDGQLDGLAVARGNQHRIVAPFAVTVEADTAVVHAREGVSYQVVVDGQRVVSVRSQGVDRLPLD